jgi:hypothetical protein
MIPTTGTQLTAHVNAIRKSAPLTFSGTANVACVTAQEFLRSKKLLMVSLWLSGNALAELGGIKTVVFAKHALIKANVAQRSSSTL